ncbi:MAG TPA: hypothetical protein VMU51_31235 [Mycobacteriales bacterium]|nr:hypothetical protein [Mycobacteriales bacterium]
MVEHGSVRPGSSPRSWALVTAAAAALSVVLAGCSGGSEDKAEGGKADAACPAPSPAPAAETALMPAGMSFDKVGTVTHVATTAGHLKVQAVTTKPLDEVTVLIQDAVTAAGYRPGGMDSEEDEAEVFFTTGSLAAGQARVRRGGCAGQWAIDLDLIDRVDGSTPTASASTTATP